MLDQVEAAAYHEAGHVVALKHCDRRVTNARVNADGSGDTEFDDLPADDQDVILAVLAGMHSEPAPNTDNLAVQIESFNRTVTGAGADMKALLDKYDEVWLAKKALWHQTQHDRAAKFVQAHQNEIRAIARAILAKPGFPKSIDEIEIDAVLAGL